MAAQPIFVIVLQRCEIPQVSWPAALSSAAANMACAYLLPSQLHSSLNSAKFQLLLIEAAFILN